MNLKNMYNTAIGSILVLIIAVAVLFVNFKSLMVHSQTVYEDSAKLVELSNDMLHVNNYLIKLMRLFVINHDMSILQEYESILNNPESLEGKLEKMAEIGLTEEEEKYIDELMALLDMLAEIEERAIDAFNNGDSELATSIINSDEYFDADNELADHTSLLIESIVSRSNKGISDTQQKIEARMVSVGVFLFLSLTVFLVLQLVQRSRVLKPIREIQAITDKFARGDTDIKFVKRHNDEIGALSTNFEKITVTFRQLIDVIQAMAQGDFTKRVEGDFEGKFLIIRDALNTTVGAVSSYIDEINDVLASLATGDLRHGIDREYIGEFALIKDSIN